MVSAKSLIFITLDIFWQLLVSSEAEVNQRHSVRSSPCGFLFHMLKLCKAYKLVSGFFVFLFVYDELFDFRRRLLETLKLFQLLL